MERRANHFGPVTTGSVLAQFVDCTQDSQIFGSERRESCPRPFRYPPDARVSLEQLMLRLQPIAHIVSVSTATFHVDLICAQLGLFTSGMGFGSDYSLPTSVDFSVGLGVVDIIWLLLEGFAG